VQSSILDQFFKPRSVALIGATNTPGFGHGIPLFWQKNGWLDRAYLVNPKGGQIHGKEAYRSISELPGGIDLAVVIVPSPAVREVLIDLGKKGIRAVIIESAGFAETGPEGKKRQEELAELAKGMGIRLIGPNCVGVVNTENRFATIEIMDPAMEPGSVAIMAQSGVFGNILLDHLPTAGLKISKVATLGNKIDLDEADFLDYFAADPGTRVILIYMEGTNDGQRFLGALRRICRIKPVVILKSGRTPYGREATLSHTASLSGEDRVFDAAFRQAGAIRAMNLQEMVEIARVLIAQPPMQGRNIGILTTSGSLGAMTADIVYQEGMRLPPWEPDTIQKIKARAPGWMNVKNPLDIGPSGIFRPACEAVFADPNPDGFILIPVIPYAAIEIYMRLGVKARDMLGDWPAYRETIKDKPVVAIHLGYREWIEQIKDLSGAAVATVSSPEAAVRALSALYQFNLHSEKTQP
jgi:acyl-CoA synthetase (NDP forming)